MDYAAVLANIDKRRRGAEFFERAERIEDILWGLAELQEPELAEKMRQLSTLYAEVAVAWHDHSLVRSGNEPHQPEPKRGPGRPRKVQPDLSGGMLGGSTTSARKIF